MKILRIIGIAVGILVAIGIVLFVVAPKSSYFEQSIVIDAPKEKIFQVVNNMTDFNAWSPWYEMDPEARYEIEGPEDGPGSKLTWYSEDPNVGNGAMWIHDHSANEEVAYKMAFEGYPSEPIARLKLIETDGGTAVTWTYEEENTPGLFRLGNLVNATEMMLSEPYTTGLSNLKEYVETMPDESITITNMPAMSYAGITATVESSNSEAIGNAMGESYGKLTAYIGAENREMQGMPFAIYTSYDETSITMVCALPVNTEGMTGTEEIEIGEIPEGKSVKAIHQGPYETLNLTHTAVDEFMKANGLQPGGAPYEIYITDPGLEPDPSKWITWVVYPL